MMRRKKTLALAAILALVAVACTHDFDAYQATADGTGTSPEGSTSEGGADGSTGT